MPKNQGGGWADILRVHLRKGEAGLKERSDIMVDQLRAIDSRRLMRKLGKISRSSRERLAERIRIILG
ncbi:type II toxin-antitoxin system PemK/MazF family toxin [Acidobacteria bacterium AH-259-O06]|nr:type II toxin-antitoxin system PemK/MazF family toxin [Acidobacteria bacterium AH-259-O06]